MIDPQSVDQAPVHQVEHQSMAGFEYRVLLHPQRGEVVDVEEATVIDLVRGHPPEGGAVALGLDQQVQALRVGGVAFGAVVLPQTLAEVPGDVRGLLAEPRQMLFVMPRVPLALHAALRVGLGAGRQVSEGGDQAGQIQERRGLGPEPGLQPPDPGGQDQGVLPGIDREAVLVIEDAEGPQLGVEGEAQLAAVEDVAVVIAQDGQQHLGA